MKKLDKILNVKPASEVTIHDSETLPVVPSQEQTDTDIQYARSNLYDVAEKGKDALEDMIEIARQSQHPKAYEVLNQVLKTLIDVNSNIVDLQVKKQKLERSTTGEDNPAQQIMNNLFVGSTSELQQMLAAINGKPDGTE